MPEKFRANDSQNGRFRFWKKQSAQSKHRRNALNPAKDIISQANDVVNKYIMESEDDITYTVKGSKNKINKILFSGFTIVIFGALIYYLIH